MQQEIYLRRKNKVIINASSKTKLDKSYIASVIKEFETVGYLLSKEVINKLFHISVDELQTWYLDTIKILRTLKGAHRIYKPMYPNFPQQVMEASDSELYLNAILHYFGDLINVRILPEYEKKEKFPLIGNYNLTVINLGSEEDFISMMTGLFSAKTSLSDKDKEDVEWFLSNYKNAKIPETMPHKENMAYFANVLLKHDKFQESWFKTPNDILRLAVAFCDGDVSLAQDTKFKNISRSKRRLILNLLNNTTNPVEQMISRREVWLRLGEVLHVGEFSNRYKNSFNAFKSLRNNNEFFTFNGSVEESIINHNIKNAIDLLKHKPGILGRKLDHLLRISHTKERTYVLKAFKECSDNISTPVLLQIMNHFQNRNSENRFFFPKGNVAKIYSTKNSLPSIDKKECNKVVNICKATLRERFYKLSALNNVYVDPKLKNFVIPFSQRSANSGARNLIRGSRIPFDSDKNTIRFFIWWKDIGTNRVDIDLSAIMYDEQWTYLEHISYMNLRSATYKACHSGDITSAPNGACEFIDLDIDDILSHGGRYILMNINSFTGQTFNTMPECFAGWIMREAPQSGEIFEAKTVIDKFNVTSGTKISIPMILDLKTREIIWADLALKNNPDYCINIENNKPGLAKMGYSICNLNKPNLYDLFGLHAKARAINIVDNPEKADTIFSVENGTPFDFEKIISEYL